MSILSLKHRRIYYLHEKGKSIIKNNDDLSGILGSDIFGSHVKFVSLTDQFYIFCHEDDLYVSKDISLYRDLGEDSINLFINRESLEAYLSAGFIAAPYTIFRNVFTIPPYSLVNLSDSQLTMDNYFPGCNDEDSNKGFYSIEDFEVFLKNLIEERLRSVEYSDNVICTLSGGADSALLLHFLSGCVNADSITSLTCTMTGLIGEAEKARRISEFYNVINKQYAFNSERASELIRDYVTIWSNPVSDSIYPVYTSMIASLNDDEKFRECKNFILDGQGADSVLIGLPHNALLNLYKPYFAPVFKVLSRFVPSLKDKNTPVRRFVYRAGKSLRSLSCSSWYDCLLHALELPISAKSAYLDHIRTQLEVYNKHYHSIQKAVCHFFLFRIIPAREIQKYQSMPANFEIFLPFLESRFIERCFNTRDDFFISGTRRKKPIFDLLRRLQPIYGKSRRTMPFHVEYGLGYQKEEIYVELYRDYKDVFDRYISVDANDFVVKIVSLNEVYKRYCR
ncbi:hypothetical protein K8R14_01830 [bacterium]|nr:hypothetical protein [bacterium]